MVLTNLEGGTIKNYIHNDLYVGTVSKFYSEEDFIKKTKMYKNKITLVGTQKINIEGKKLYSVIFRKILFKRNQKFADDLLYKSPRYKLIDCEKDNIKNLENKIVVNNIISIKLLLEEFGYDSFLNMDDIKSIYKFFLNPNSKLFKKNYPSLPIKFEQFIKLRDISNFNRKPTEEENEYTNEIKEKIKIYSFK